MTNNFGYLNKSELGKGVSSSCVSFRFVKFLYCYPVNEVQGLLLFDVRKVKLFEEQKLLKITSLTRKN